MADERVQGRRTGTLPFPPALTTSMVERLDEIEPTQEELDAFDAVEEQLRHGSTERPAGGRIQLPSSLLERCRTRTGGGAPAPRSGGSSVLYILRTTYRVQNNPALEVALHLACQLGLPLICVAVVEDCFPPSMSSLTAPRAPTDRAAAFRLEALKELQREVVGRGTVLWVHVERDVCRPTVAPDVALAEKAAIVVTDEHFGVEPHASVIARVAQTGVPVCLVDGACTVPSVTLQAAALRGGNAGFLRATSAAREPRLAHDWLPPPAPPPPQPPPTTPPAWAVDLNADADAVDAVLEQPSRRDRFVARVRHTRGGSKAARARWTAYVAGGGLRTYAAHRNNPLAPDGKGASRMSAYVNLGMIDPYVMARDALNARADKFLSEFVGFRESAHLWCLLHPGKYADASVAVPAWAQGQMRAYALAGSGGTAARLPAIALSALEAGRTGDRLWDDCQRSLVQSGELHNNVRMAWGKAIPAWHEAALASPPPAGGSSAAARLQAALDLLIHLNDRFALDGCAPPSYGGLLWCLGWRDRPGDNGCPTVRPTSVMASRIRPGDLEERARRRCSGQALLTSLSASAASHTAKALAVRVDAPVVVAAAAAAARTTEDSTRPQKRARKKDGEGAVRQAQAASGTLWQFFSR